MFSSCLSIEHTKTDIEDGPADQFTINGAITLSEAIFISGITLPSGDGFIIDFCVPNDDEDIALRIDVRYATNSLSRNSRIQNHWGIEEIDVPEWLFLIAGMDIELQLFFTEQHIAIAFNNKHLANYCHRLNFKLIDRILISRDIMDLIVYRKPLVVYPKPISPLPLIPHVHRPNIEIGEEVASGSQAAGGGLGHGGNVFLPLPYYYPLNSSSFEVGRKLIITGEVSSSPKLIKVTLQLGHKNSPRIMQLEIGFPRKRAAETDQPIIALNTFAEDNWSGEDKFLAGHGLRPGGVFDLHLGRHIKTLNIQLNQIEICGYPYKLNPRGVDTCCIEGDIHLISVSSELEFSKDLELHI